MTKIAISRRYFVVITSWLERIDSIKTFDNDPLVLEQDIIDIRQLLEESDKRNNAQNRRLNKCIWLSWIRSDNF